MTHKCLSTVGVVGIVNPQDYMGAPICGVNALTMPWGISDDTWLVRFPRHPTIAVFAAV